MMRRGVLRALQAGELERALPCMRICFARIYSGEIDVYERWSLVSFTHAALHVSCTLMLVAIGAAIYIKTGRFRSESFTLMFDDRGIFAGGAFTNAAQCEVRRKTHIVMPNN